MMDEMDEIRHRFDLVDKQYLKIRENVAKIEKVQYMIREQVGFIEYMAMAPNYPNSLEERMQGIINVVEQIRYYLDESASIPVNEPMTVQEAPVHDEFIQPVQPVSAPLQPAEPIFVQQVPFQEVHTQTISVRPVQQAPIPVEAAPVPVAVVLPPQLEEENPVLKIKARALNEAEQQIDRSAQSSAVSAVPPAPPASVPRVKKSVKRKTIFRINPR
jgi:hypothetical protein